MRDASAIPWGIYLTIQASGASPHQQEKKNNQTMDKIQLLPDSVANQIAAGEVIQRPASVIKELVENAVDAGADKIQVLVTDAGKASVQVIDNGMGMSVTDARLAFERHATSKIRKAEDLFSLHTMGFRGEALPSIASVAQVTLKTRMADDSVGTQLRIEGSKVISQEATVCQQGCNFLVENLFFNVPARRRFLKSNATEMSNIVTAFQRIALVYPAIDFTLANNGQTLYALPVSNTRRRIIDIFGKKLNPMLLPVEVETSLGNISGFVGKPESAHKKNVQQYFFVNGRYMRHAAFHKAVMSAYERLVPQGEQVPYFIYFDVKPDLIDVNIHPTKTEIKFQDESAVWQILAAAVRETIGRYNAIPAIEFDTEGRPDIPVFDGTENIVMPTIDIDPLYNPFKQTQARPQQGGQAVRESSLGLGGGKVQKDWAQLYDGIETSKTTQEETLTLFDNDTLNEFADRVTTPEETTKARDLIKETKTTAGNALQRSSEHYQYRGAYILTSVSDGLMVTDQERAHERILYERYLREMDTRGSVSQKMLFPETVELNVAEMMIMPEIMPDMQSLGFELTNLGGGTYAINAIPAELEGMDIKRIVSDMIHSAADNGEAVTKDVYTSLARSMARKAAIPHGQALSNDEMERIIADLMECENTRYTPSGKPIFNVIPNGMITHGLG